MEEFAKKPFEGDYDPTDDGLHLPTHNTKLAMKIRSSTMGFFSLPNEILFEVVDHLDREQDIYSLIRVHTRFYNLFDDYLYCYNIKHRRCSALFWAVKHGRESTARKLLHLGADVNLKLRARSNGTEPRADLTPLHLASLKGQLAMVKLLLEAGADPEARCRKRLTPLFFALIARHGEVARTISSHISNLQDCLVDVVGRLTPLHVSCHQGLWSCAEFFLNGGANVDAVDANAMTPLHHALLIDIEGEFGPGPDEIFETVKVLVDFRADQYLKSQPRSGGEPITAYECGANHPHDRVRALFFDCAGENLRDAPKHKSDSLRIGRTWMQSSFPEMSGKERDGPNLMDQINIGRFLKSSRCTRTSIRPDNLDPSFFPLLNSVNRPQISRPSMHISNGPWSPSNINSLIAGFTVVDEPDAPPIAARSAQVDPFPQLSSHISIETKAGKSWADFGKPKGHPAAGEVFSNSANSETDSLPERKGTRVRGKNRWQPLEF